MLFFHAVPQSLAAGHKKETSKNPHIYWLPLKSSFSNCHCVHYNLPMKYQQGLFVPQQIEPVVQGSLTSTAGLCWEMAPHCWCVQWAHVRADSAAISPGTPAGCCQWLDSAPWHLSQLHGVHRRPLPRYLNTLHKTLQNVGSRHACTGLHIMQAFTYTYTPTCTHEDEYPTLADCRWSYVILSNPTRRKGRST